MLIGMLFAMAIVMLLYIRPSFDNVFVALAVYGGLIVAMVLAFIYSDRLSAGIAAFLLGSGNVGKIKETYSLAERFEIERNFKGAIEIYRRAIERDKTSVVPRLKLADLYYQLNDFDNCLACLQQALNLSSRQMSVSERCSLMNRMADLYLHNKAEPAQAVEVLRRLIKEHPKSKYALYARDRIMSIKEQFKDQTPGQ
jgi:tetratricopeptide (TPR) repeat protein